MYQPPLVKARFVENTEKGVVCDVCERRCVLRKGHPGICGNYVNMDNIVYNIGYGRLSSVESRPIEIKPLFHYWPNSTALTYSNYGCNFYCPWCQNHSISFNRPKSTEPYIPPSELVKMAVMNGDDGLSASFNEPATQTEYIIDVTEIAIKHGLYSMIVTNMYFTKNSLKALIESGVDGFSADIKGCPSMKSVLPAIDHNVVFRNAKMALDMGAHVEMIYLVVTDTNDFDECVEWIINNHLKYLGVDVPLHVNRYYPAHRWNKPPTPVDKLIKIRNYAVKEGLKFVYVGNIWDPELESTRCPNCKRIIIYRSNYRVLKFNLEYSEDKRYKCKYCGELIPIKGHYIGDR
ncbi:MAG: radical SAM protein [Desulfurococcaceae archaeon]